MISNNILIQFADTDASGRIHYSSIFRYFEVLDHQFFKELGYPYKNIMEMGYDVPRVHVECSYLGTIAYDDDLEGQTFIAKIGHSSYTLAFNFYKENVLVAKGSITNVFIDRFTGKSTQIPDFIRTELVKHLDSDIEK